MVSRLCNFALGRLSILEISSGDRTSGFLVVTSNHFIPTTAMKRDSANPQSHEVFPLIANIIHAHVDTHTFTITHTQIKLLMNPFDYNF